jgi:hypothetical protein
MIANEAGLFGLLFSFGPATSDDDAEFLIRGRPWCAHSAADIHPRRLNIPFVDVSSGFA